MIHDVRGLGEGWGIGDGEVASPSARNDMRSARNDMRSARNDMRSARNDMRSARNDMGPVRNDMVILGRRIDPGRQDVAPTGRRFCNLPPPTYGGMESAFKGVSGTSKAGETSTDVNTCQHISTHVNTPQGRRGYPPYMGFAFLFGRGGKAACGLKTCYISIPKPPNGMRARPRRGYLRCVSTSSTTRAGTAKPSSQPVLPAPCRTTSRCLSGGTGGRQSREKAQA
jgi:hypothetical protein